MWIRRKRVEELERRVTTLERNYLWICRSTQKKLESDRQLIKAVKECEKNIQVTVEEMLEKAMKGELV